MSVQGKETIDFDALEALLRRAGLLLEAAEAHGSFCGFACLMGPRAEGAWIAELMSEASADSVLAHESAAGFGQVARVAYSSLEEGDMGFGLLLPPDNDFLAHRAEALAQWCQGFMHGLSVAEATDERSGGAATDNAIVQEILEDFSEIARAEAALGETDQEGEAAYAELVEYVRVSVQLIYEEISAFRQNPSKLN